MDKKRYDALVIGAGGAGDPLARELAQAGKQTVLVERGEFGGTCANRGCTPSKTLRASARIAYLTRNAAQWGIQAGPVQVNMPEVQARKQSVVSRFQNETEQEFKRTPHLDVIKGEARFIEPQQIAVRLNEGGEAIFEAPTIVINTGTRPAIPDIEGLISVPFFTSDQMLELTEVPKHLLVLGGNYIGVEMAQMFRRFGSAVTLIESEAQLLPHEDEEIVHGISDRLRREGILIHLGSEAKQVENRVGKVCLLLGNGTELNGTHLLVATGRAPNTEALHLLAAGIAIDDKGFIQTDSCLQTNVPGVWACGDVTGGAQFSHMAYDDFRVLHSQLLGDKSRTTENRLIPYVIYTDPPLGRVGLNEREAKAKGIAYRALSCPMCDAAYPVEKGETDGLLKVLVQPETQKLLGASAWGLQGDALSTVVHTAMLGNMTAPQLADINYAHPTLAETLGDLLRAD